MNRGWSTALCLHLEKGMTADWRDFELDCYLIFGQGSCCCWTPVNLFTLNLSTCLNLSLEDAKTLFISAKREPKASSSVCTLCGYRSSILWSGCELLKTHPLVLMSNNEMEGKVSSSPLKMQKRGRLRKSGWFLLLVCTCVCARRSWLNSCWEISDCDHCPSEIDPCTCVSECRYAKLCEWVYV